MRLRDPRPGRWLAEIALGIDRRRTLPSWTRQTLSQRLRTRPSTTSNSSTPSRAVILFRDTFTEYAEPEIGIAALELLEGAGMAAESSRMGAAAGR